MPKLLITLNIPCYAPFAHASLPTHTLHSVAYAKAPPKIASPNEKINFYITFENIGKNDLFKAILRACKKFLILLYLLKMLNFSLYY